MAGAAHPVLRVLAAVAIALIAYREPIQQGLEVGHVAAVLLAPLWIPAFLRHRGAPLVAGLIALSVVAGAFLTGFASADHATSSTEGVSASVLILGVLASVGVVVWARTLMRDATVAVWFGVGLVAGINPGSTLFATNPWKFGLSVPLTVLLLALAWRTGRRWIAVVVLVALIVMAGANDFRSDLAILLLVLLVVLWDMRPATGRRGSVLSTLLVLAGLAVVVYQAGQALILEGYLGEATRERTERQLDEAGSVIAGGRPELGAATALFQHHPWGFGSGTLPNLTDIQVAKTGMAALNYDPDNGYVENYLFGSSFELHSVLGDLWTRFGLVGIALTFVLVVILVSAALTTVTHRTVAALLVYVIVRSVWNMPFSPLYSAVPLLVLALGLSLAPSARPPATSGRSPRVTSDRTRTARRTHVRDAP